MKDRVFFTDKVEERKSFDVYFTDNGKPTEYFVRVVRDKKYWNYYLCHSECPDAMFMAGVAGVLGSLNPTVEEVLRDVEGFINEDGDKYISAYEKKFLCL